MTARLSLVTTSPFPNVSALILKHSDPSILFLPPFFWRQQFFWQPKIGTTIANHFFSKQMFVVESHQQHPFVAMLVLLFMDCICRTFRRVTGVIEVLQGCQKPTENLPGQTEGFDDSICIWQSSTIREADFGNTRYYRYFMIFQFVWSQHNQWILGMLPEWPVKCPRWFPIQLRSDPEMNRSGCRMSPNGSSLNWFEDSTYNRISLGFWILGYWLIIQV